MLPIDQFTVTLSHNETRELPWEFSVPSAEYNRLQFLLFNETVPGPGVAGQDRINASYRDLHLWLQVRPA